MKSKSVRIDEETYSLLARIKEIYGININRLIKDAVKDKYKEIK